MKGTFVVFEGQDRSGKSTAIDNVLEKMPEAVYGKGLNSKTIAGRFAKIFPSTLTYLVEMAYITYTNIVPNLIRGKTVLQDRYEYSVTSFVPSVDKWYNRLLVKAFKPFFLKPDMILYFTCSPEKRRERLQAAADEPVHQYLLDHPEILEGREKKYHELMRNDNYIVIDTTSSTLEHTCNLALDKIRRIEHDKSTRFLCAQTTIKNNTGGGYYETRSTR
jgi:thymidylate kinase